MNLMAESGKNQNFVNLQSFIKGQENENAAQQCPVSGIVIRLDFAESPEQKSAREQQQCAEQCGQVQLSIHVHNVQPMFIGAEAIDAHLSQGVGHQQCCGGEVQGPADHVWSHRRMVQEWIDSRITANGFMKVVLSPD